MTAKISLLFLSFFFGQLLSAQRKLKTIKATSVSVDIRDGSDFIKNAWTISPEIKPDIYTTSSKGKVVTFYTDKDSISVKITTKTKFDFIILLNDTAKALTQIAFKPSYLDKLKGASKYNFNDNREIPKFTYQDQSNPNLAALRKGFNLDSIAGYGNDVSKILNLLHWIHNLIPHDGNHENPTIKNAMSMIAQCKKEVRGLNCRGLSTVLNECYLSMGFKSRFITCMPKDSIFDDCHVINSVYLPKENKWIWIDPTNNAYVMNEKGELLSIEEVRERIINDKPIILNPDANWNNKSSTTKQEYLYNYMAKNLYRLQCPLVSEYDTETWKEGKKITFVELLPLDAFQQKPDKSESTNTKTGTTFTYLKTNNPNSFWQTK
ncbi:MAG: transglutaminase domain-containing protein [Chitinophagaceae bacterium]|nr:transglutaminase domain-containing protein [Chitinophagaceae bacterium]